MREYQIFLSKEAGVFGGLRKIFFISDEAALAACRRLLDEFAGVDIWRGRYRIGLLRRGDGAPATAG